MTQIEEQSARENPLARKHHTWKNLLSRRAAPNALGSGIDSTQTPGQSNTINQMLELAKGFEPPTL
jgi:hypothetical protein